MSFIITLIVGGLVGWIASIIMHTDSQQGLIANIVVGIVGSLLGAWIFGSLLGLGSALTAGSFSLWGILWGIIGAVILIAILKAFNIFK